MTIVSLDVECAATGRGHNDRAPCRISIVNEKCAVLLDISVRVPNVFSPLTPITGMTRSDIENAKYSLEEALCRVHSILDTSTIIVGQSVQNDIEWLQLEQGIHFRKWVGIEEFFKTWNPKYGHYNYFSLRHEAFALLGKKMLATHHCSIEDAITAMELYCAYDTPYKRNEAGRKLTKMRYARMLPTATRPNTVDGVCSGKYNQDMCFCGQAVIPK